MEEKFLRDRTVLIAGGAGAVGEGLVGSFLAAGARVFVPSRAGDKLAALREKFAGYGAMLTVAEHDVGTEAGAANVRDAILQEFGRLDAVVASLGGWWQGLPLVNLPLETWDEVLRNNLTAHFIVAKSFLPVMLHQNRGSYTFIAGLGGTQPVPNSSPVSVAVAGEIMLARALHAENRDAQVRINTLLLGVVNTRERRSYAEPHWITAEAVGQFAAALAADAQSSVRGASFVLNDLDDYRTALEKLRRNG